MTLLLIPALLLAIAISKHAPHHKPIAWLLFAGLAIDGVRWLVSSESLDMGLALLLPVASAVCYWRVFR